MILRIWIVIVFFITTNVKAKENLLTGEEISKSNIFRWRMLGEIFNCNHFYI